MMHESREVHRLAHAVRREVHLVPRAGERSQHLQDVERRAAQLEERLRRDEKDARRARYPVCCTHSANRARPWVSGVAGAYPSASRAREMSAHVLGTSPG
jgi:hypothetical protein